MADFTPVLSTSPRTLSWTATDGSTSTKQFDIVVEDDTACESSETFDVFLKNVDGGELGTQFSATATIVDDDCKILHNIVKIIINK